MNAKKGYSVKLILKFALTVLVLLSCTAVLIAQDDGKQARSIIVDLLKANQVSRISILHLPSDLETRTRINQHAIRRLTRVELSFTKPAEEGIIEPLQAALEELRTGRPCPVHEVRWGILFLDGSGKERAAVFLDRSGQFIQIGDTNLQVQGKMLAWVTKSIHDAFR